MSTIIPSRPPIEHERLAVYDLAIDLLATIHDALGNLPRNRAGYDVGEQLQRAAMSIALDIAEGSGEFQPKAKVQYYRSALRCTARCAAIFDILANLHAIERPVAAEGKQKLEGLAAQLTALIRSVDARTKANGKS